MKLHFGFLLLLCAMTFSINAQNEQSTSLNIGDPAPPLRVREWIKGMPIQKFEEGKVYVVEFWATWCGPCKAEMPHLSALAHQYKDKVTILGIDVYEEKTISLKKIKAFVDSMGYRMDYHVATEDSNFMVVGWLNASGDLDKGIPRSFVVNAEGRLAWIGHPKELDEVLPKIVNNVWDIKEALAARNFNRYLTNLDDSLYYEIIPYLEDNRYEPIRQGKPDSVFKLINQTVGLEPALKYAPKVAYFTFSSLLKTNRIDEAYEYGKIVIKTPTYEEPNYVAIRNIILECSDKVILPSKIYELGVEALQIEIADIPYPELVDIPLRYHKMAKMYWLAGKKHNAVEAEQKAIETLKSKKDFSLSKLAEFEAQLQQYQNL